MKICNCSLVKIFGTLLALFLANSALAAFSDPLYQCPFAGDSGDQTSRGFYVENYPSSTLGGVVLSFVGLAAGPHSITLHARENTYDGALIGSVTQNADLKAIGNGGTLVEFDFANAAVNSSIVTFSIEVTSGGLTYYDVGTAPCTDVTQTNGTNPPLDSIRRQQVGVEIYGVSGSAPPPSTYSVGGTTAGLSGTVTLQNNGSDDLAVNADGPFTFATALGDGSAYAVTVLTQPTGQTCTVSNGSGTISAANVTSVAVNCVDNVAPTYTVSGVVSGLSGAVTLQNNGSDDLAVNADGPFTFATALGDGSAYAVTVLTQPKGQTCTVSNGSGTISAANVTSVAVDCMDDEAPPLAAEAAPVPAYSRAGLTFLVLIIMLLGAATLWNRRW